VRVRTSLPARTHACCMLMPGPACRPAGAQKQSSGQTASACLQRPRRKKEQALGRVNATRTHRPLYLSLARKDAPACTLQVEQGKSLFGRETEPLSHQSHIRRVPSSLYGCTLFRGLSNQVPLIWYRYRVTHVHSASQ